MPYTLVNGLKELMRQDFPSQLRSKNPYLGKHPSDLPEEILEKIDSIADSARSLFGSRIQPTQHQASVMAAEGFEIVAGRIENGIWRSGVIRTPKGLIEYS